MRLKTSHVIAWSVGAVTAAVLAGGVAYATIPDANGKFNGCVAKTTGALRLIDGTAGRSIVTKIGGGCGPTETPVGWSSAPVNTAAPDLGGRMFRLSIGVGDHRAVAAPFNGIVISANCAADGASLTATAGGADVQYSGASSNVVHVGSLPGVGTVLKTGADVDYTSSLNSGPTGALAIKSKALARFDGLITSTDANKWMRLTMTATYAAPCSFWGVLTPVTGLDGPGSTQSLVGNNQPVPHN
jgi:hypothetical protein